MIYYELQLIREFLDFRKGFVAYDMLDSASVLCRRFGVYSKLHKKICDKPMPLKYLLGNGATAVAEGDMTACVHIYVAAFLKKPHSAAYAGL